MPGGLDLEDQFVLCLGRLVVAWSICESNIWGLFSSLTETENGGVSPILWLSHRSTSSRVNVVDRLIKSSDISEQLKDEISSSISTFNELSKTRNFFCHAWYAADVETLSLKQIQSHRLNATGAVIDEEKFTPETVTKIVQSIEVAGVLSNSLWKQLYHLREELGLPNGSFVLQHAGA